jgi:hypothetical protein
LKIVDPFGVICVSPHISQACAINPFSFFNCNPKNNTDPMFLRWSIRLAANDLTRQMFFQKASLLALDTACWIFSSCTVFIVPFIPSAGFNCLMEYCTGNISSNFEYRRKKTASRNSILSSEEIRINRRIILTPSLLYRKPKPFEERL